jgi:hypothetical protein
MTKLTDQDGTQTEIGQFVSEMVRQAFDDLDIVQRIQSGNSVSSDEIKKNLHYAISELTRAMKVMDKGTL